MKLVYTFICLLFTTFSLFSQQEENYPILVNPFIGTGGHGHTYPGATTPFGMVQLSPDTRIDGSWDGCSGYHYSDSVIYGFSHTHLNGTGVSDYGDFSIMPTYKKLNDYRPADYASKFKHSGETAFAGYYSVYLEDPKIRVELTASPRVGFHQYTFDQDGKVQFVLDFTHRDEVLEAKIEQIDAKTFKLTRRSRAWAQNQHAYAYLQFEKPVNYRVLRGTKSGNVATGNDLLVVFEYDGKKGEKFPIKLAYSFTSTSGAQLNATEIPDWDFGKALHRATELWEKELSKIKIYDDDPDKRTIFYTALYHTMQQPNIATDLNGDYLGRDFKIHHAEGFDYYTVFSLWDTYRAAHPLYTLIETKRTRDFIITFLKQYEQGGKLPVWELSSNETNCMIGYHAVPVIAEAMAKGFDFDYQLALDACMHSANANDLGLSAFNSKNFISVEDEPESVSKTLEYAYDDWCIAQMAKHLGKDSIYHVFLKRSHAWQNMLDPQTKLMRPRFNGGWISPFDGREVNNNYTEANSWQYSFYVPQDIAGLIQKIGGEEAFEKHLDELFTQSSETTGREQVDITGLIGQYAHGNEPSQQIAYLYNYIGKPEKTQAYVKQILDNFYKNTPDGLIGNEDCGQMSAWYVLSAMGIYPVTPNLPKWDVTKPYFRQIYVFKEDKTMRIVKPGMPHYRHEEMGFEKKYNKWKADTIKEVNDFVETPYITDSKMGFDKSRIVEIKAFQPSDVIYYQINDEKYKMYKSPFKIKSSVTLHFYAERNGHKSSVNTSVLVKRPNDYSVHLLTKYNSQYTAGGPDGLIDGIFGNLQWKKGGYQGYQKDPLEAVIDLKKKKEVSRVGISFLQDSRSWILNPSEFSVFTSDDGINFHAQGDVEIDVHPFNYEVTHTKSYLTFKKPVKTKFIKVVVKTAGDLPPNHQGFGGKAFIFIDEILIE